jgi:methyl-accepting chemotaxis protein
MGRRSIATKMYTIIGISIAVGFSMTAISLFQAATLSSAYTNILDNEVQQALLARQMQTVLKKEVQEWKDVLLRGSDPQALSRYSANFRLRQGEVVSLAKQLHGLSHNANILRLVEQFQEAHEQMKQAYEPALKEFAGGGGKDLFGADRRVKGIDRAPTDLVDTIVEQSNESVKVLSSQQRTAVVRQRWFITISAILACAMVGTLSFYFVSRIAKSLCEVVARMKDITAGDGDLTRRIAVSSDNDEIGELSRYFNLFMDRLQEMMKSVANSAHQLTSASEEISASASQMAQGVVTQQNQTTQVTNAVQEMSSSVAEVSGNSNKAAESAHQAAEVAQAGGKIVNEAMANMRDIAQSVTRTAQKIQKLGENSDQIGKIIAVIDDIADQTNLLALNAAIEAARAGEQGRGFAVVADEVRKLAERTTNATQEIAQMIETVQQETRGAVDQMQAGSKQAEAGVATTAKAGDSLEEIITAAQQVGEMISQIAIAAAQQSSTAEQISSHLEQIAKITSESATGVQQSAKACEELSSLAVDLEQLVGRFKLDNGEAGRARAKTGPVGDRGQQHCACLRMKVEASESTTYPVSYLPIG